MSDENARLAAVLRAPLGEFVAMRTQVVRELRAQGDDAAAKRVAALRKPSTVVWALDQAGAVAADDLAALRDVSQQLRQAQGRVLKGDRAAAAAMQQLGQQQRQMVDTVARRLGMVLSASGHAADENALRRLREALRGAVNGDDATWRALADGRLTAEPADSGFPVLEVTPRDVAADEHARLERETRAKRLEAAETELQRAEDIERAAREQEQAARERLEQATCAVTAARAEVERLRRVSAAGVPRSPG